MPTKRVNAKSVQVVVRLPLDLYEGLKKPFSPQIIAALRRPPERDGGSENIRQCAEALRAVIAIRDETTLGRAKKLAARALEAIETS